MAVFSSEKLSSLITSLEQRTGKRWTIREISDKTNISPAYLTLLKNGQRDNPSMDMVIRLSQFFQVPTSELLTEDPHETSSLRPSFPHALQEVSNDHLQQTLNVSNQLIESGSSQQALEILNFLSASYVLAKESVCYLELQNSRIRAMIALKQWSAATQLLQELLNEPLTKEWRAKFYIQQSTLNYAQEKYEEAVSWLLQAKDQAEQGDSSGLHFTIHYAIGNVYNQMEDLPAAIHHYQLAMNYCTEQVPLISKAHLHMGLGVAQMRSHHYQAAMDLFLEAKVQYQTVGESKYLTPVNHNIACVQKSTGHPEEAIELLKQCLQDNQTQGNQNSIANDLLQLALCHKELQQWKQVGFYALRAALTFENCNLKGQSARASLLLAEPMLHDPNQPDEALETINDSLNILLELNWKFDIAKALQLKSIAYQAKGQLNESLKASTEALELLTDRLPHSIY